MCPKHIRLAAEVDMFMCRDCTVSEPNAIDWWDRPKSEEGTEQIVPPQRDDK